MNIETLGTNFLQKRQPFKIIKNLLNIRFLQKYKPGFGKYCQSIEVNDISVVPKDERYHKFKEVPRKRLI